MCDGRAPLESKSTLPSMARERDAIVLDAAAVHVRVDDGIRPRAVERSLAFQLAAAILLQQAQVFGFDREAQVERVGDAPIRREVRATERESHAVELPRIELCA